jgi:hypothetical protein
MPFRELHTIGELKEYIEEAMRRGAKPDNGLYIRVDVDLHAPVRVYFVDDDCSDEPPFMFVEAAVVHAAHVDDDEPMKVHRKAFGRALKKAGNDLRRVKIRGIDHRQRR